jgi:hypothetical protein
MMQAFRIGRVLAMIQEDTTDVLSLESDGSLNKGSMASMVTNNSKEMIDEGPIQPRWQLLHLQLDVGQFF